MSLWRPVMAIGVTGMREPARKLGLLFLVGFGCFACFAVSGCFGCNETMVVNGQRLGAGERLQMAQGASFYLVAVYAVLSVGLLSAGAFTAELAGRTGLLALARPIHRWQYVAGRALLPMVPAISVPLALGVSAAATYGLIGKTFPAGMLPAVALLIPNLVVLGVLVAALGQRVPSLFAAMAGWAMYAVSATLALDTVRAAIGGAASPALHAFQIGCDVLLPPFGRMQHLAHAVLQDEMVAWTDWLAIPWQLGYLSLLMAAAIFTVRRKDL